jgi:ATP-dependent Clp protease ATP-binding subunit ClpA
VLDSMLINRLTPAAEDVLAAAEREARLLGHSYLGPEHLVLGLLANPDTGGGRVLTDAGVRRDQTVDAIIRFVGGQSPPSADVLRPNAEYKNVVYERLLRESLGLGLAEFTTDVLLLAIVADRHNLGAQILADQGLTEASVREALALPQRRTGRITEVSDGLRALRKENEVLRAAIAEMRPVFDDAVRIAAGSPADDQREWTQRMAGRIAAGDFGPPPKLS